MQSGENSMTEANAKKTPKRSAVESARGRDIASAPASVQTVEADGVRVFYRTAGEASGPVVLLLHGFPTSSFMFRELIPRLAGEYRVIAPDLPGFGFTQVPAERKYEYSFANLALTIDAFTKALRLDRYAM